MGTLRSMSNQSGRVVNGIELGDPIDPPGTPEPYAWNDSRLPNGVIAADGTVTVDAE